MVRGLKQIGDLEENAQLSFDNLPDRDLVLGLLSLRMKVTKAIARDLDNGRFRVKEIKLAYRRLPQWFRAVDLDKIIPDFVRDFQYNPTLDLSETPSSILNLTCSVCSHTKQVANLTLFAKGIWKSILCTHCRKSYTCRKWLCECGASWYRCRFQALVLILMHLSYEKGAMCESAVPN